MTKIKVGKCIKNELTHLLELGVVSPSMIDNLKDQAYCSKNLGISYPVLVEVGTTFEHKRYYVDVVVGKYRICSQWCDKHKMMFDNWRIVNGM